MVHASEIKGIRVCCFFKLIKLNVASNMQYEALRVTKPSVCDQAQNCHDETKRGTVGNDITQLLTAVAFSVTTTVTHNSSLESPPSRWLSARPTSSSATTRKRETVQNTAVVAECYTTSALKLKGSKSSLAGSRAPSVADAALSSPFPHTEASRRNKHRGNMP